ncbi:MAG: hypothetical protein R6U94_02895 [Nitriliruptoraceae bacterium]
MAITHLLAAAAGAGVGLAADRLSDRLRGTRPTATARLVGTTVAAPTAALWITDFLNAAYYAREDDERDLADLRLAFAIVTTFWHEQGHRQIGARDVLRFHRAFGTARLQRAGGGAGTLDADALLAGGDELFGDWFSEAARDPARRGWGIVFRTLEEKEAHDPQMRLELAQPGPLAPPRAATADQIWSSYPPVEVTDAEAALAALHAVDQWPEYGSELGRFTPLRRGGLLGQTFEIEVIGFPSARTPVLLRAYVTVERLVTDHDEEARDAWLTQLRLGFAARAEQPSPIPEGAEVHAILALVSHEGHFMGNATSQLVVYTHEGHSYVRAIGVWDPMPWHLAELYDQVGQGAQHAFWGMGAPEESMLHQLAAAVERGQSVRD